MSVYVLGSINQDIVVQAQRHPKPGETLHGSSLMHYPGGKGANQAVAAALAGAKSYMIGAVGNDAAGEQLRSFLEESNVNTDAVTVVDGTPTGTALITVAAAKNTIVVVAGANGHAAAIDSQEIDFSKNDVLLAQFETPLSATIASFQVAHNSGATTMLNPSPAAKVPLELLEITDYLIVNEHEFELVFGNSLPDSKQLTGSVADSFKGTVIVTLGENGAVLISPTERLVEAGRAVKAVDSTGAGDCFVGYFAAGINRADALTDCLRDANTAAALSVTKSGAAVSMPTRKEIE